MAIFLFTKAIIEGKPIKLFNHGKMRRDFTYIDDVSRVVLRLDRSRSRKATMAARRSAPAQDLQYRQSPSGRADARGGAAGEGVGPHGAKGDAADAARRRAGNLRRCRRSDARHRLQARRPRSRTAFAILSRGIATTTRFEAPMDRRIIPLIMCGGAGTRLWPASREVRPEAVPAVVRGALDVSGYAFAGVGCGAVRAADRHHQHGLSLHGAGATGRDRARGRCAAGADAAGFRPGDRGGRGVCADARQRGDRSGARRRSRRARYRRLCRRLPPGAGRGAKPGAS